MFKDEDRQTLQSLINNRTITQESQRMLQLGLDAIGTTIKFKEHFWHFQDELLSNVCQLPNEGIHALSSHITNLITQCKFPMPRPKICSKSWSCNMQCNTMRPETGSSFRNSPISPTTPFLPNASCLSHDVSSIRRPRRRDELTSLPLL